jgi:hypothetical protein
VSRRGATLVALAVFASAASAASTDATPPDASALLARAFHNLYADDYVQVLSLATQPRVGRGITRRLQIARRQSVAPGKALVRFLEPPAIRRTSVLILENDGASDDLYVYLPALRRTRHLSASQRADSFFGTDLSYEEIEPKDPRDWDARFDGAGEHAGLPCARLSIRPRAHFESTYDAMISCVETERGVVLWTEFERKGEVVRRLEVEPGRIRAIGSRHIPFAMTVISPRRGSRTEVRTESYELRPDIPDALFSTWNLQAGNADRDRRRSGAVGPLDSE